MTLKNHRNYYNVKFLSGYGLSISLKDSRIILKNGQDIITGKSETEGWFITNLPYEKIVVSGKGYVSFDTLKLLNENNRTSHEIRFYSVRKERKSHGNTRKDTGHKR